MYNIINFITGSCKNNRSCLLVYRCETIGGSFGGLILKVTKGKDLAVAALHRGGHLKNRDGRNTKGFNFGSLFTDIKKASTKMSIDVISYTVILCTAR